ncbi:MULTISPECIES: RNA polymerase sigma factor [Porphyromonas]|uniref:RNA polymerase sigma factor n=1 Tax=Porphyromonas TaxID=836 RepID=UPI00051D3CD7|nr:MULTISPECIES: RNA polymerase sigma factor [Porphyromonas]KGL53812.1 RNA polymerase sigma70 factor [Porphyromonas canoris]KGN67336.1 RNA polymerase sigma70 factor [Porphyromonas sp. COT-108 OH1349]
MLSSKDLSRISEEELLRLLQQEETKEQAFSVLLKRYSPRLYAVIRRIVLFHEDANDVLQESLYKIWKNIALFKGNSRLYTWMHTIATNEALSHLRSEKYERKVPLSTSEYDLAEILMNDPYFDGDNAEALLHAAIATLPEKQKLVFQYRYFDELSYNEISQLTDTSVGALKADFHHAQKKVKQHIEIESD